VFSPSCCFRSCTDLNPSFDSSIFQFNHRLRSHRSTSPWRRPTLRSSCVKLSPLVLSFTLFSSFFLRFFFTLFIHYTINSTVTTLVFTIHILIFFFWIMLWSIVLFWIEYTNQCDEVRLLCYFTLLLLSLLRSEWFLFLFLHERYSVANLIMKLLNLFCDLILCVVIYNCSCQPLA
jgi:hypothetical protein